MKITKKYDKPMSGIDVYSLDGLGCACTSKRANGNVDVQKQRLETLRNDIIANPAKFVELVNPANAVNAINYVLKYWDNPVKKAEAIAILKKQHSKIFTSSGLGNAYNSAIDNQSYKMVDSYIPGGGDALKNIGVKPSNFNPASAVINLFSSPSQKNANNAAQRAVLDKFTIPADFDLDKYYGQNPDVVAWAGQQGLNDAGYVLKQIAWHYFEYGKKEGRPYPYKNGTAPVNTVPQNKPSSGVFDWIGGQDNNTHTGFHIGPNNLEAGDSITIDVVDGDKRYSGTYTVLYKGADDGSYKDSIVTVNKARIPNTVASGNWYNSGAGASSSPSFSSMNTTTKVAIGAGALFIGGLIVKKLIA